MHTIVMLSGAARKKEAVWPLQARHDTALLPIDYERSVSKKKYRALTRKKKSSPMISTFGKRGWKQIRHLEGTIDLYGWSTGFLVGIEIKRLADKHRPGFVRALVGICPAVYGGSIPHRLHLNPKYIAKMWFDSNIRLGARTIAAVREIRQSDQLFSYRCWESKRAMLEAIRGVVQLPDELVKNGDVFIFYSPEDQVIPAAVTEYVAKRSGIVPIPVTGYDHDVPLLDTKGEVLSLVREMVAAHYDTKKPPG